MKRIFSLVLVSWLALFAAGCAPQSSLFGLFKADDKEFEQRLLGEWKMQSGAEFRTDQKSGRIVFERSGDAPGYLVTAFDFDEKGMNVVCAGRLTRLGSQLFIDFGTPDAEKHKFAEFPFPLVSSHIFGRVQLDKNSMRIDLLSDDWVKEQAKTGTLSLATVETKDGLVLSAPTEELRKFALEHAGDSKAFSETFSFRRKN